MIANFLSKIVLTLGPSKDGKGGMASVLDSYSAFIFRPFYFEKTTGAGSLLFKSFLLLKVFICIPFYVFIKNIKIIHIHGASRKSFIRKKILINYCSLFPVKIIFHLHGAEFHLFTEEYGAEKIRKTLSKCQRVIVLSKQWEEFMHNVIHYNNVSIVNNIIPYPKMQVIAKNDAIRILYLGIIGERKGVFDLLSAINSNKDFYKNKIKLTIGGNGEVEKLKQYIEENRLEEIVEYAGWVSGEIKIRLLNECDLFVLPSYNEGLPISILEAMSYGKAVVATNVGGIPEIVKQGCNGYLMKPGDKENLNKCLRGFIQNKELLQLMGNNSLKLVKPYLSDNVAIQLENIYKDLLKT
jgi:glycosyltransferase involved in cell wall biosynthesis